MTDQEISLFVQRARQGNLYWRSPHTGEILKVVGYSSAYKEFDGDIPEPVARLEGNKSAALVNCSLADFVTVQPAF